MASHAKDGVRSCPRAECGKSACPVGGRGWGNGATAEPLRHRQTKGAETDMLGLTSPRHTSTLPIVLKTRKLSDRENLVFAPVGSFRPIVLTAGRMGRSHAANPVGPPNPQRKFR